MAISIVAIPSGVPGAPSTMCLLAAPFLRVGGRSEAVRIARGSRAALTSESDVVLILEVEIRHEAGALRLHRRDLLLQGRVRGDRPEFLLTVDVHDGLVEGAAAAVRLDGESLALGRFNREADAREVGVRTAGFSHTEKSLSAVTLLIVSSFTP